MAEKLKLVPVGYEDCDGENQSGGRWQEIPPPMLLQKTRNRLGCSDGHRR